MGTRRREEFYAKKMQIERRKRNARALCALVVSATLANTASAQYTYIAGYEPRSDVTEHAQVDLDIRDIISSFPKWKGGSSIYNGGLVNDCTTVADACNWNGTSSKYPTLWDSTCTHTCPALTSTKANQAQKCTLSTADACLSTYGIYKYGKGSFKANSASKNAAMRTLFGFADLLGTKGDKVGEKARVAAKNNPFINKMNKYWMKQGLNELTWGKDIIEVAFKGTCVKNGNSCVKSGGVNLLDFGLVGNDFRVEVIKKGIIYLNIFPYVIWEFQDAINDCHDGQLGSNDPIPGGGSVQYLALTLATSLTAVINCSLLAARIPHLPHLPIMTPLSGWVLGFRWVPSQSPRWYLSCFCGERAQQTASESKS